jgi:hypothetical protein
MVLVDIPCCTGLPLPRRRLRHHHYEEALEGKVLNLEHVTDGPDVAISTKTHVRRMSDVLAAMWRVCGHWLT